LGGLDRTPQEIRMMSPLPTLAALAAQGAEAGLRETFRLADGPQAWVTVLVIVPALVLVAWLSYRREAVTPRQRVVLATLRCCALAILVLVLTRPVLVQRREEIQKAEVLVLVDDSASMRRQDAYEGDEAVRKALAGLAKAGPDGPGRLADTTRSALAAAALGDHVLPRLAEGDYGVQTFGFAGVVTPFSDPATLTANGGSTQIGAALSQVLAAHRGRHVTDILLLSDGRQNGGLAASEAARAAASQGVPVHTVVIGDTRPERNALLELVEAPTSALEGDEISITVRVLGRGTREGERAGVVLEELDPQDRTGAPGRVHAEAEIVLSEGGQRTTLTAPARGADARGSERRFRVSLPPLDGETLLDDNKLELAVRVTPEKVRVLYVDGYPRWEYRFLKELLKRADENIQVQVMLLSAGPDFRQESTRGLAALREVPTDRKTLLDNYDVVILGDVNPWAVSPDSGRADEFLRSLVEFVERGGGLLLIAGEYDNPRAYVSTPLEALFPVELDSAEMAAARPDTQRGFQPVLEDPANPHEIVRLLPDVEANRRLWEEPGGLEGQYWYQPVSRAKPGSQVLLRHPDEGNSHGRYPLMVAGYYPSGRTLFLALDSSWMWRYHYGDRYHERFWRGAIRWLALGRLKSGDRRYRIEVAQSAYDIGSRVELEARVLDEDFQPATRPAQGAWWSGPDGRPNEIALEGSRERPGLYRGVLEPDQPGLYRAWIEVGGERITSAEFEVVLPSLENRDPAPDPGLLREIARLSGGRAVNLAQLGDLWSEFPGGEERREPISSRLEDVWDRWATLLAALGILAVEWVLRKRWELV
jgi:uncharacterized membrane protein